MPKREPRYGIDPIEPGQVATRLAALLARLEPLLLADDVAEIRSLVDGGEHAAAFARLDAVTDDATVTFETSMLVELVLLGQAIRAE